MKEVTWLTKPKTIVCPGSRLRDEHIRRQRMKCAIPPRPPSTRPPPNVSEEPMLSRIAVVVEDPVPAIEKHMIAGVSGPRLYPDSFHLWPSPTFQECIGKDMACAACEEHAIRQCPPHHLIALSIAGCQRLIHSHRSLAAELRKKKALPFAKRSKNSHSYADDRIAIAAAAARFSTPSLL
jgi:hypothetical protein